MEVLDLTSEPVVKNLTLSPKLRWLHLYPVDFDSSSRVSSLLQLFLLEGLVVTLWGRNLTSSGKAGIRFTTFLQITLRWLIVGWMESFCQCAAVGRTSWYLTRLVPSCQPLACDCQRAQLGGSRAPGATWRTSDGVPRIRRLALTSSQVSFSSFSTLLVWRGVWGISIDCFGDTHTHTRTLHLISEEGLQHRASFQLVESPQKTYTSQLYILIP